MSFSIRKYDDIAYIFQNSSTVDPNIGYWNKDFSGNLVNNNSNKNVNIVGQIVASNGLGVTDQVLSLSNTGTMIWKDVSGSGGLANSSIITDTSNTTTTYYPTFVDGSGNKPLYINSTNTLVYKNLSLGIGTNNPQGLLDVNGQSILRTPLVKIGIDAGLTSQSDDSIAIGRSAGSNSQSSSSIAIGYFAGNLNQSSNAIAIGRNAGSNDQGPYTVAIGSNAGNTQQRLAAVAIGQDAGKSNQGTRAIAIGYFAGSNSQGSNSIAIGNSAGLTGQIGESIAIGNGAGELYQQESGIAIGKAAGRNSQNIGAIAIGFEAGNTGQQNYAIAIGTGAGNSDQSANTIILNATGAVLNGTSTQGLYIKPLVGTTDSSSVLVYNPTTGLIRFNSTKTFVIDHPNDKNKYLVHSCLEGPEAGVYYRGKSEINENENSIEVILPNYVDNLADKFTVHITSYSPNTIFWSTEVYNGKFVVSRQNLRGDLSQSAKFSWHVYGSRETILIEPYKNQVSVKGDGPYKYISY